jgi:precorrin-2 dehydrogenase/sirohydrochlorin ferrochelatase
VVIGGGAVATRKALTLCDAGANVTVIAPEISDDLSKAASANAQLLLNRRNYGGVADLADADLVFAATDSETVNETIASDARSIHRLVNVASDGSKGSFVSMATHRNGQVTIGVIAGGQPKEAIRIRDSIARRLRQAERD